jgi:hypothetical protein
MQLHNMLLTDGWSEHSDREILAKVPHHVFCYCFGIGIRVRPAAQKPMGMKTCCQNSETYALEHIYKD